jgi:hypothetical protein
VEASLAHVPVICAQCRKRFTSVALKVSAANDAVPIYGVCDDCRISVKRAPEDRRKSSLKRATPPRRQTPLPRKDA